MHPSLRIIALITLAFLLQIGGIWSLGVIGMPVMLAAAWLYPLKYWHMLMRSRWLLLTLLMIFSFTTPGEYVHGWNPAFAPTLEGITSGMLQAGRLVVMLAGLALLLGSTGREALMSGIYVLIQPLQVLGLSPGRFTARLWLTLHYVEQAPVHPQGTKWAMLDRLALDDFTDSSQQLVLQMPGLGWVDALALCALALSLWWWLA